MAWTTKSSRCQRSAPFSESANRTKTHSSSAAATSSTVEHVRDRAVGTPASAITDFANALEPSSCAAAADGPKQAMPLARTASATPAIANGTSGHHVGAEAYPRPLGQSV